MIVYSVKNTVNGKRYVGATTQLLYRRKSEHRCRARENKRGSRNTPLYNDIRQFGWDSFVWEILERCCNKQSLHVAEKRWIKHFNSIRNGYNMTQGGPGTLGCPITEHAKKKISFIHKGKKQSPEFIEKRLSKIRGRKHTPEAIAKMCGRLVSEETRRKIGDATKSRINTLTQSV